MQNLPGLRKLIDYNCQVLDQALQVISAHQSQPAVAYDRYSGPHLRHIVEHYEALVSQVAGRSVDYDSRARDRRIERDPTHARERIESLQVQLHSLRDYSSSAPLAVHLRGGLGGEENFVSFSTLDRELLFVASYAVHHYALIQLHCRAAGIDLGDDFGKAPSTVRHEQQS